MLHLLLSTDWTAGRDAVLSQIREDVAARKGGRILIVPELISHDTERRLCQTAGDTASRYAEVLSFTRLERRVEDLVGCAARGSLDKGGRMVAMAAAVRLTASRLKAFAGVQTRPEFLTGLINAVDEFKRCCITPEDLRSAAAQSEGSLAQKLEELSLILEAYDSLCSQGKKDPRDQLDWLLEQLETGDFPGNHVFYIEGFPDFTRQHLAILECLLRRSPDVTVSLTCDAPGSRKPAFEKAGHTATLLLRCAREAGVAAELKHLPDRRGPLELLREQLFAPRPEAVPALSGRVFPGQAGSMDDECLAAAEEILALVRSGCRYRDIAVICADLAGYRDTLGMVFRRCHIPLYLSGSDDILDKSVMTTVLYALDAALGGFEQRQVLRYLRTALSPLDPDMCDLVENYALLWNIQGEGWLRPWKNHPEGLTEEWTDDHRQRLEELEQVRQQSLTPLEELRQGFREAASLSGQVEALYAFLETLQLEQRLEERAEEMAAAGDNRSAQELNQLWEILLSALEQLYDVLGDTHWDDDAFVRLLRLLLGQYTVGTIPTVLDAVMVGPVSAMRCQQEKHLFVLGASEGCLPTYGGVTGILSDPERTALRRLGVPLTGGAMDGLQAELAEIYDVFCGAEETVHLSWSSGQPSAIYRRLALLAGGETHLQPTAGAALADPQEAGAWFARWGDRESARKFGLENAYDDTRRRAGYALGQLERPQVEALYGHSLRLSASQIDRLAECRMAYFLRYGLRAKERKTVTVDPAEFGTYVHAVLEQTAREVAAMGGFTQVSLEQTLAIARGCAEDYSAQRFSGLDSQRTAYLLRRNAQELELVVGELWRELHESEFAPVGFEVAFGEGRDMAPIAIPGGTLEAQLLGFVDRVDLYRKDGRDYFRVVDYKTGKKDFDYCDIANGVGLQMLLYLYALEDSGQTLVGFQPIPAGVEYFPARVPVLNTDGKLSEEAAEKLRRKEWQRRGLLLMDQAVLDAMEPAEIEGGSILPKEMASREQFASLKTYVFQVLRQLVDEISSGRVDPNPYTRGTAHDACAFCPYGPVCHGTEAEGRRSYRAISSREFWEQVEKAVKDHG